MNIVTDIPPIRILNLTDERGFLCGKIIAELGADVIKIEKIGSYCSRFEGERGLFWLAYKAGKRCKALNNEIANGQNIFSWERVFRFLGREKIFDLCFQLFNGRRKVFDMSEEDSE